MQLAIARLFFKSPSTRPLRRKRIGKVPREVLYSPAIRSRFVDPERPVENVSWHDAQQFIERLNQRSGMSLQLPTEAQWEYCCRAGSKTDTYDGDVEIINSVAYGLIEFRSRLIHVVYLQAK